MSYATMQDVSFALVTDCELPDRPRQHLEPELPKEGPDRAHRAPPRQRSSPRQHRRFACVAAKGAASTAAETYGPLGVL